MRIAGMQKLTLLDYPGKVACTVFLSGCNLRCPYCHNPDLVLPERAGRAGLSAEDVRKFLKTRVGKLDAVCVSGGEPTCQPELTDFLAALRGLPFLIKLDTNGTNPGMLRDILRRGLVDYVAMDIKNSRTRYRETCGADVADQVAESAALLMAGQVEYEFRTTVCSPFHTPQDMEEIGRWLQGARQYYLQGFVDSGDLVRGGVQALSAEEMTALREAVLPWIPNTRIRGE